MRLTNEHLPGVVRLHYLDDSTDPYVLVQWHVEVGNAVNPPQLIATLACKSWIMELEAFDPGVVTELRFKAGDEVPNGAVIARLEPS